MNFFKTYPSYFLCLLLVASFAQAREQQCPEGSKTSQMVLTGGNQDDFREPIDPAYRRPEFQGMYEVWSEFDDYKSGYVGHTFTEFPCYIVGAELTLRVMPIGEENQDDMLHVGFDGRSWMYEERLENLAKGNWRVGNPVTITLDLTEYGLIEFINEGYLDVLVKDSTMVDYMQLTLTYCEFTDCNENCVPDEEDIALGTSKDVNKNGVPDECEVIVEPDPTPSIICPEDIVIVAGTDCCGNTTLTATAVDVEGDYQITNNIDPTQIGSLTWCFPVGTTTVTFTLNDYIHPPVTCTTTVIVIDNRGPVIMPAIQ